RPPPTTGTCTYPAGSSWTPLECVEEFLGEWLEERRWYDDKAFTQTHRTRLQRRGGQGSDLCHRSIPAAKHHAIARLESSDDLGQSRLGLMHVQHYCGHGSIVNHIVDQVK
ncbi:MAG: hypothetical protein NT005_15995, partial [Spirochaetes bacterium]|nr:hypothetical protein [Spirochaetota bacterium]